MATVNNRVGLPQAVVINGIDAGGNMRASIQAGYDGIVRSAPDGLQVPVQDKEIEFVRGSIVTQDWIHAVDLLTGTVGTLVFYERKSGVAEATGYIKHTITNPVIHRAVLNINRRGFAGVEFSFECRAADETKGIADMWTLTDDQAAPTYISAARGGYRVESAAHNTDASIINIYHVTQLTFSLQMPLVKECNDGDVGYTCVDARLNGMAAGGSIGFQDGSIDTGSLLCQQLITAVKSQLAVTVTQSQGATSKLITILGCDFSNVGNNSDVNTPFTEYSAAFDVANDPDTQLTIAGDNKIITIANVA